MFHWTDLRPRDLLDSWKRLTLASAAAAVAVHASIQILRSQRFRVLLPAAQRPRPASMLAISAAHNLAAYVLPAKTGEMALVMYLRTHSSVTTVQALAALFVSRMLDLATLCLSLAVATAILIARDHNGLPPGFAALCAGLVAGAAALMLLSARSDWIVRAASWLARGLGAGQLGLGLKLLARAEDLSLALRQAPAGRALWIAAAQSLAMWIGIFVTYEILARAFGLDSALGLAHVAFGSSLSIVTNLLPINSFAGFGTQEGGWVLGFGLLGVPRDAALSTGLGVHLAQLASTVLLGLIGQLALLLLPGPRSAERADADRGGLG